MKLRNLPGGVPEPGELIGRDHVIDMLWLQLSANNILLVAPRRFGKTGVMRHVLKLPRENYCPVYIDVEAVSDPENFATELLGAILEQSKLRKIITSFKRMPQRFKEFITSSIDEFGPEEFRVKLKESLGVSWQTIVTRLILEMEKSKETVVFIIDEFPQMIDNIDRKHDSEAAKSVMAWFRSLRMKQKEELRSLRFIIAGSTSVDMTLRCLGMTDKLNDFFRLPIDPLEPEDAQELLNGLAEFYDLNFSQEAIDAFFKLINPHIPYFIHLFVSQLILEPSLKDKNLSPDDISRIYHKRILGPSCHKYFDYYRQRLKRYGKPGERAAIAILREIAGSSTGKVPDSSLYGVYKKVRKKGESEIEFREIMADLECDWYVSLDTSTNEYFFLIKVMKDWWNRFYRRLYVSHK